MKKTVTLILAGLAVAAIAGLKAIEPKAGPLVTLNLPPQAQLTNPFAPGLPVFFAC